MRCQEISLSWNAGLVPAGDIDHERLAALEPGARCYRSRLTGRLLVLCRRNLVTGQPEHILRDIRNRAMQPGVRP